MTACRVSSQWSELHSCENAVGSVDTSMYSLWAPDSRPHFSHDDGPYWIQWSAPSNADEIRVFQRLNV